MIEFRHVSKSYGRPAGRRCCSTTSAWCCPRGRRSACSGATAPASRRCSAWSRARCSPTPGRSAATRSISWPLGFSGSFHADLTGAQNIRFVARIYGMDTDALVAYVEDFAELGDFMDMPVRSYSSGMRARLAFGMSMGIAFDWYLVDEITAVGDTAFKAKCLAVFKHRLKDAGMLMVSHSPGRSAPTAGAASCSRTARRPTSRTSRRRSPSTSATWSDLSPGAAADDGPARRPGARLGPRGGSARRLAGGGDPALGGDQAAERAEAGGELGGGERREVGEAAEAGALERPDQPRADPGQPVEVARRRGGPAPADGPRAAGRAGARRARPAAPRAAPAGRRSAP